MHMAMVIPLPLCLTGSRGNRGEWCVSLMFSGSTFGLTIPPVHLTSVLVTLSANVE